MESTPNPHKYFESLREFEVSIIARFCPFSLKLSRLALLNRAWNELIFQNYSWACFPELSNTTLGFVTFFD